ncbi:MAG: BACON domain-containing protein [Bryobacterales bacterium]|nr:BACON domain-containing protein [Bryobacterales bacterium]
MKYNLLLVLFAGRLAAQDPAPPSGYRWDFYPDLPPPVAVTNDGRLVGADYLFTPGQPRFAIAFPGANSTAARDGNSSGAVVGSYSDATGTHGFLRGGNGVYTAVNYPASTSTTLLAINDNGAILGTAMLGGTLRYFLRTAAGAFQLLDPANYDGAYVDLNNSGILLGVKSFAFGIGLNQAVSLVTPGQPPVPTLTCGGTRGGTLRIAFNDRNDYLVDCISVGAGFFQTRQRYVQFANGESVTLFNYSANSTSYSLASIAGINAARQIAGTGQILNGSASTVLLTPCVADASVPSIRVLGTGGSGVVRVLTEPGCRPTVATPQYWITHSQPGAGPGTISYSIPANTDAGARTGTLRIGRTAITVLQDALPADSCVNVFTAERSVFPASGGQGVFGFSAGSCPWTLTGVPSWITVTGGNNGSGYGNREFTVAPNTTAITRTATITAGSLQVRITQLAASDCSALVSASSITLGSFEGIESGLDVVANPSCAWRATSAVPWLQLSDNYSGPAAASVDGSGSRNLYLKHDQNNQSYPRAATVAVGSTTVAITQQGRTFPLSFVPLLPCRVADTRPEGNKQPAYGPPSLAAQGIRSFSITAAACGVPLSASAVVLNITVVPKGPLAFLTAWPAGQPQPLASTLNSFRGRVVANAAVVPLGANGAVSLYASHDTDVVIDVNGYFASDNTALAFYSVNPCRVADTRAGSGKTGEFGAPGIPIGGGTRSFRLPAGNCAIPPEAKALSLNLTAVPAGYLAYVSMWPTGQEQPFVSTLNSWDGQVVANAAIIPAGTDGAVSIYSPNATDLVLDVNGYFAPLRAGGLRFYPLTPCRVTDTRNPGTGGPLPGQAPRTINVFASNCGSAPDAKAYSLNFTAVPPGPLGYLTAWPTGVLQPLVSILNSLLGDVVANAALVPAGTAANIDIFGSNTTDVIIDLNGFYLP